MERSEPPPLGCLAEDRQTGIEGRAQRGERSEKGDLDAGHYALYAHLRPGSVAVRPGRRVSAGELLGRVGNSGNTSQPHLHFHVMDRPSPLDANGLPYVFDQFQLEATVDLTADSPQPIFIPAPRTRRALLPMTGDLLGFR